MKMLFKLLAASFFAVAIEGYAVDDVPAPSTRYFLS